MKARYIKEQIFGCSIEEHLAHWVEIEAFSDGINVAKGAKVTANFKATQDVPGHSLPNVITDGNISLNNYVSVILDIQNEQPAEVIIDLEEVFDLSSIRIWHGWWEPLRAYFSKLFISENGKDWHCLYDYEVNGLNYELSQGNLYLLSNKTL